LNGDNNTSYFHKIANGRKRKNIVLSLKKDGEIIGDENLLKHATEYYTNLFGLKMTMAFIYIKAYGMN
jgi:hypothetical protein